MKIIKLINQNIPIWSMLDGDHALRKSIKKIDSNLINYPNFLDKLENKLRENVFYRERKWIIDNWGENPSFAIVEITYDDLMTFDSCLGGIPFEMFVDEHVTAIKDSKYKFLIDYNNIKLDKPRNYIKYIEKFKIKTLNSINAVTIDHIDDSNYLNSENLWLATNRSILIKNRDNKIKIVDGTHRLTSYSLLVKDKIKNIPKKLYAFYCEK